MTCLPIVQEVLQGIREPGPFRLAKSALRSLPTLDDPMGFDVTESAVNLYRPARRGGLTVRSSVDCVIAAVALKHGVGVLHVDRDYAALAKVAQLNERMISG